MLCLAETPDTGAMWECPLLLELQQRPDSFHPAGLSFTSVSATRASAPQQHSNGVPPSTNGGGGHQPPLQRDSEEQPSVESYSPSTSSSSEVAFSMDEDRQVSGALSVSEAIDEAMARSSPTASACWSVDGAGVTTEILRPELFSLTS